MDRIKLNLPKEFAFSTTIQIRITDVNYGGHVGNDAFLALVHEARLRYLNNYGYSELKFETTGLIMADAGIEFKKELMYADEVKISVQATGFDKFGFDIFYLLEVKQDDKYVLAGKAKTGMLCINYETKKLSSVPQEAIDKLDISI